MPNLPCATLKNIFSEKFLQIVIKVSVAVSIFSKILCFQRILLKTLRRMRLNYENCFLEENLILEVKTTFRLQKPHCENVWWKHIKNESWKCYLGNREQKLMFLVVSRSDVHFDFEHPFFACPIGRAILLRAPRKKFVHLWNITREMFFFKKHAKKEVGSFLKKLYMW